VTPRQMLKLVAVILTLCLAFSGGGCGAWPLDVAVTVSRKPQWGIKACVFVEELGFEAGKQKITGRVFGFVRGRDWWGADVDAVWPPVRGMS
jgi:hypothetical protein